MWGAMIAGFAHNRLQREALEYVRTILPGIGEVWGHKLG